MIRCNLAVLLAERNLRISQVAIETRISRTTLTALFHNTSTGMQFETLNTLCNYLDISPEQLIAYAPVDITLKKVRIHDKLYSKDNVELYDFLIRVEIKEKGLITDVFWQGAIYLTFRGTDKTVVSYRLELEGGTNAPDMKKLQETFSLLGQPFIVDIKNEIATKTLKQIEEGFSLDSECSYTIKWPFD